MNTVGINRNKYVDGSALDCSNSIADALELLQSCTKPLIWCVDEGMMTKLLFYSCYFVFTFFYIYINNYYVVKQLYLLCFTVALHVYVCYLPQLFFSRK